MISVLMSVYKEPLKWVEESINSILNQTFSDFEFIIVNDNPASVDLCKFLYDYSQKDKRIKIISNHKNIGLTKSLNIGLKLCKGKYIARMDADDISMPTRFEKQVKFMESHPDVIVCGTNIKLIGKFKPFYIKPIFSNDIDIRGQMFHNSGFIHPSVFIRKCILNSFNISYDETFRSAQDYKLWYDLRNIGRYANLKEKLLKYRISDEQVTSKLSNNQQQNRKFISNLFKQEWIHSLNLRNKYVINKIFLSSEVDLYYYYYYIRSETYLHPTANNLFSTALSLKLNISPKERMSLLLKSIIKLFKDNP